MSEQKPFYNINCMDCLQYLKKNTESLPSIHLTFFDPPYRQGKDYKYFNDSQPEDKYWEWIAHILSGVYDFTTDGGAIYFMQREKNLEWMMKTLRETHWNFQNLILWKKLTSAVPSEIRFGKSYQPIVFATKGEKPRVFNKLRIDYPLRPEHKYTRPTGLYLTDIWDDIRELTSGYFAGDEALRDSNGDRVHEQQSPVALLLRIILSSTLPGDTVFDPVAGSGTTLVVSDQLMRNSIGVEIDPEHCQVAEQRLTFPRPSDEVLKYRNYYRYTSNLDVVWPLNVPQPKSREPNQIPLTMDLLSPPGH